MEIQIQSADERQVESEKARKRRGENLDARNNAILDSAIFIMLAHNYRQHNWAMQIHFGAIRNNNSRMYRSLGSNTGFDSLTDQSNLAANLNQLLDAMAQAEALPKTILYN
ncbi:glucuronate isomerase, partial [Klebsiella pneumoniae]|uniref:glucuronate isomerase n=1 Tax=Klebsiella pneumoniae TaxID=573 RepID=UPI001EF83629